MLWLAAAIATPSFSADKINAAYRLKSCDSGVAKSAAEELLNDPNSLKSPIALFGPALALFQNGDKDTAVFWFYAAQLRTRYKMAIENSDEGNLLSIMLITVGPQINNYAFRDIKKLSATLDQVLTWDRVTPNPTALKTLSDAARSRVELVYRDFHEFKSKIIFDAVDIERKARESSSQIDKVMLEQREKECRAGELDPALAQQTIQSEMKLVADFVKLQPSVLKEVAQVEYVGIDSYKLIRDAHLPGRYTVAVQGGKSTLYAEVDVLRSGGSAQFSLACTTYLGVGQRDPRKDVCSQ